MTDAFLTKSEAVRWAGRATQLVGAALVAFLMWGLGELWDGYKDRGEQLDAVAQTLGLLQVEVRHLKQELDAMR